MKWICGKLHEVYLQGMWLQKRGVLLALCDLRAPALKCHVGTDEIHSEAVDQMCSHHSSEFRIDVKLSSIKLNVVTPEESQAESPCEKAVCSRHRCKRSGSAVAGHLQFTTCVLRSKHSPLFVCCHQFMFFIRFDPFPIAAHCKLHVSSLSPQREPKCWPHDVKEES